MGHRTVCLVRYDIQTITRWVILILPLLLTGCFDSPYQAEQPTQAEGMGIAAIGRFFSSTRSASNNLQDADAPRKSTPLNTGDIWSSVYQADRIASAPVLPGLHEQVLERSDVTYGTALRDSPLRKTDQFSGFATTAELILNSSFGRLFSNVFRSSGNDGASLFDGEEFPNPFTEARQKQESLAVSAGEEDSAVESTKQTEDSSDIPQQTSTDEAMLASVGGTPVDDRFLIIGDFDGSGALRAIEAKHLSGTSFVSGEGEYGFNLFVASSATDFGAALSVDDMDGDGDPDLLVAIRGALFGGVMLGDGNGGYELADKFVNGYESNIPFAGPFRDGRREILTVNTRSGVVTTFEKTINYRKSHEEKLAFAPDYVLHLVEQDTSLDYIQAAQTGGAAEILQWGSDGRLKSTAVQLPWDVRVWSGNYQSASVDIYQVGNYASVVITSRSQPFNVANMRIFPQVFLIIGDLDQRGYSDVSIGNLEFFTPAESAN
jgi:hypothetical protein